MAPRLTRMGSAWSCLLESALNATLYSQFGNTDESGLCRLRTEKSIEMGPVKWLMFPTSGELGTPRKAAFVVVFQHFWFGVQMESRRVNVNANEKKESMFGYLNKEVWNWNWICDYGLFHTLKNWIHLGVTKQ